MTTDINTEGNNRQHIRKYLASFVSQEAAPRFAVLIDGDWGAGKTHFLNRLTQSKKWVDKIRRRDHFTSKPIYRVSLFGKENLEDVRHEIFLLSCEPDARRGYKLAGLVSFIPKLDKYMAKYRDSLKKVQELNDAVLIFDDFERSKIDADLMLGFINQFVEHSNARVIIVANEEELLSDETYLRFKEKLIGQSFKLEPDVDGAMTAFLAEFSDRTKARTAQIKELFAQSGHNNLRALRQFLWHLDRLLGVLSEKHAADEDVVAGLTKAYFFLYIEVKLGLSNTKEQRLELNELTDEQNFIYSSINSKKEPTLLAQVHSKYSDLLGVLLPFYIWKNILKFGSIDPAQINSILDEVVDKPWQKLWRFDGWELNSPEERKEFENLISELRKDAFEDSNVSLTEFFHAVGILISMSRYEYIQDSLPEVVAKARGKINLIAPKIINDVAREIARGINRIENNGYGFLEKNSTEFEEIFGELQEFALKTVTHTEPDEMLRLLRSDRKEFLGNFSVTDYGGSQAHLDDSFLAKIDADKFVEALLSLEHTNRRSVITSMKKRYDQYSVNYKLERPWWEKVHANLSGIRGSKTDCYERAQMKFLLGDIERAVLNHDAGKSTKTQSP